MLTKVSSSPNELIETAIADFEKLANTLLAKKPDIRVLLTGGTLGIEFVAGLGKLKLDYSRISLMFSDERFVPLDHPDRNEHQGISRWPELAEHLTRFPGVETSILDARNSVENSIRPMFEDGQGVDLSVLGLGPDGHIASLFPGHNQPGKWVIAETNSPKPPSERLSLSYQALNISDRIWFLAAGREKAWAVSQATTTESVPASSVHGKLETVWYLDSSLSDEL